VFSSTSEPANVVTVESAARNVRARLDVRTKPATLTRVSGRRVPCPATTVSVWMSVSASTVSPAAQRPVNDTTEVRVSVTGTTASMGDPDVVATVICPV